MKVKNMAEAWRKADNIFPTDYVLNSCKTEAAGYPIYTSTAENNLSWISDLGTRLELNIETDYKIETINLVIEEEPEITVEKRIDADSVRNTCIAHNWYTCGDIRAYDAMLTEASKSEYSVGLLFRLATDIVAHSEPNSNTVENCMYILEKEAVSTFFDIEW